jgi:hypothetical protein
VIGGRVTDPTGADGFLGFYLNSNPEIIGKVSDRVYDFREFIKLYVTCHEGNGICQVSETLFGIALYVFDVFDDSVPVSLRRVGGGLACLFYKAQDKQSNGGLRGHPGPVNEKVEA